MLRIRARSAGAGLAVLAGALASVGIVLSAGNGGEAAATESSGSGNGPQISVYATGLNNPRGLEFGPDGNLWVAESGRGAEEITDDTPTVPDPEDPEGTLYIGETGAFSRIVDGEVERVFSGLPSVAAEDGSGATGPVDLSFDSSGGGRGLIGLGATAEEREQVAPGALLGYLGIVDSEGEMTAQYDIAAFESEFNPDGGEIDTNPNGVLAADNGGSYIADAGSNALLHVDGEGNISVVAVFVPRLTRTPQMLPQPPYPPRIPMQSVPTAVTQGPDGALYVSELTGFPFTRGGARIWRVMPGEPAEVYQRGFTNIIDIAFDDNGNLWVLEIDSDGIASEGQPFNGSLWRVPAGGDDAEMVVGPDDLFAPGGLTIGPDGAVYVTNNGILPEQGEVLRIEVSGISGDDDNGPDDQDDDDNGLDDQGENGDDNGSNGQDDNGS